MAQNLTVKICHFTQGHGAFDLVTFQLGARQTDFHLKLWRALLWHTVFLISEF